MKMLIFIVRAINIKPIIPSPIIHHHDYGSQKARAHRQPPPWSQMLQA
jgi:hypothetical protein